MVEQAVHRAAAVVLRESYTSFMPSATWMWKPGPAVVGLHHLLKGLVGDGEQGVAAEHGLDHVVVLLLGPVGDEVGVLLDGLVALLLAVPVADLIAQAGPDAQLLAHVLDGNREPGISQKEAWWSKMVVTPSRMQSSTVA